MKKIFIGLAIMAAMQVMAQTSVNDTIKASFPGGEKALTEYIETNRKYPQTAANNGIEGVVEVRFVVKADGSHEQLSIVRLVDPDLETEAIRLVDGMPAWIPASAGGKSVDSNANVRIPFILPD